MKQAIQVWVLFKVWLEDLEKNRRAGCGILVTSRESSTIQMGNTSLKVSSPSLTIAGSTTQRARNEISFWLEEFSTEEEFLAIGEEFRGEQGCYLVFDGTLDNMSNKKFITKAEYDSRATEYQLAFAQ